MLAQGEWTQEKVAYTRAVLTHYLTNVSGLIYGDKTKIANTIADNNGLMSMGNTTAPTNSLVSGQDLQNNETVIPGSAEFMDLSGRNAAFEEILHFVHDHGLSTSYPAFQSALEAATSNAIKNQLWTPWGNLPVADYDNEYMASYNYSYWGIAQGKGATPYVLFGREAASAGDPEMTSLMTQFQPVYFTATMPISNTFSGTFHLQRNTSLAYTEQSQYYRDIQLLGSNNSNIVANSMDNTLIGNAGNNEITGGKGNDNIDGAEGSDIARFSGSRSDYVITTASGTTTITDNISGRDGTDTLTNVEKAIFSDMTVNL